MFSFCFVGSRFVGLWIFSVFVGRTIWLFAGSMMDLFFFFKKIFSGFRFGSAFLFFLAIFHCFFKTSFWALFFFLIVCLTSFLLFIGGGGGMWGDKRMSQHIGMHLADFHFRGNTHTNIVVVSPFVVLIRSEYQHGCIRQVENCSDTHKQLVWLSLRLSLTPFSGEINSTGCIRRG